MKGFIYKIYCNDTNEFYLGSTINTQRRKSQHKYNCRTGKESHYKIYEKIRKYGGWKNWKMDIIDEVEIDERKSLYLLEKNYIENLEPTLNKIFLKKKVKK